MKYQRTWEYFIGTRPTMSEPFTTAIANRKLATLQQLARAACPAHACTPRADNICGRGQFGTDFKAHLGFKRMVSCSFRDKRMCLKTRAYGILSCTAYNVYSSTRLTDIIIIPCIIINNTRNELTSFAHSFYTCLKHHLMHQLYSSVLPWIQGCIS